MTRAKASRLILNMDALLVTPGLIPCSCLIERVSQDGPTVRFQLKDFSSPAVHEQISAPEAIPAELHIFPDDGQDKQHFHFKGLVPVGQASRIFLEVTAREQTTTSEFERLLKLGAAAIKTMPPPGAPPLSHLYNQHCRRLLEQLLPEFMENTFEGIESDLQHAAELRDITRLKDMRFIFQSREQRMLQDFQTQFQANQADLEPSPQSRRGAKELHLLEQHEFEDWLDLQAISNRINSQHRGTTFLLNQFLNQIFKRDVNDNNNPLTPRALSVCLQYMVDHLGITREHRQTIYRAWESALAGIWPAAIRSMINDFRRGGLEAIDLTELPANWSSGDAAQKADSLADKNRTDATARHSQSIEAVAKIPTAGQSLFRLMALEEDPGAAGSGWQAPNPKLTENIRPRRAEILDRLRSEEPDMEGLLQELAASDAGLAGALDRTAVEKASLVDRIFAPLKTQEELSEPLRHHLQMLRLPIFETLVETPDFLNDENHPARSIINNLMHICLAERASSKKLEATVAEIIDELTNIDASDPDQLEDVGERLRQLVERQNRSFIRNSERLAKNLEGKERLRQTRRAAGKRLNALLAGRQTPRVLIRLLEAGWEQLIVLAMLREGPEARQCEELFEIVSQLQVWLSADGTSGELAFEKELESGVTLRFIERELKTVGNPALSRSVIDELTRILEGHQEAQTIWIESYGDTDDADTTLAPEVENSRWAKRARDLAVGDWVEIRLDSSEVRRMRLVWGGEESLRFVFLSPKGMSEVSFNLPEFVEKLADGQAWLVKEGDVPFLDQSLFAVVENIYRKLNFQATHDALTGCMHRHDFEKQILQRIHGAPASSEDPGAALLILDIDEFSVINASYGADAGDALLKHVAETLRNECRMQFPEASTGRISGNEFAAILDNVATEDCLDFAESIRRQIERQVFHHGSTDYRTSVSISIRPVTKADSSPGDLLNQASLSLRTAKKQGGNRIELVRETDKPLRNNSRQWVTEIDRTIQDGSLYLRAQPIVSLDPESGEGNMYELLLGLKDSSGAEVSPQGYIEAAEQFRRSTRVDTWVVSEIMSWMRNNPDALEKIATLNVNLSGASLSDDSFMLGLETMLRRSPELAHKLCFEVTETSAVANLHFAADFMTELKRLNCRFALDDFGTGLSSYAYLQKLPVDYVKIDGIFVRDLTTNMTNYAMVRSINELCHFLDLRTIAEYVEDMETMEALREIQVDYGQGFGIAKPRRLDSLGK
jgi:diguanylate cyclase (GGDEF)-like protein